MSNKSCQPLFGCRNEYPIYVFLAAAQDTFSVIRAFCGLAAVPKERTPNAK
jgi:hypothetical protein